MRLEELKDKKILILGYSKEGKATEKFLNKFFPEIRYGIADKRLSPDYLKDQINYDLVIKTPGISKNKVVVPYTTATNIFFANTKNKIIGVTGTKGKSTTASLIFSILKEAGYQVYLLGNIGQPMLEALTWSVNKNSIFVCELSSYQLDDISYSPTISVILDLFPDHMTYHGNITEYYQAKKNIINFQKSSDFFVYNPDDRILKLWSKNSIAKAIAFTENLPVADSEIPLIGSHNRSNIRAAVTVARIMNIEDKFISTAIKKFKPLPHRLQSVGKFRNIEFYDDAISTTPESTIFAIKALKNIGTIFLGGEDRGYNFSSLIDFLIQYKIPNIVFFPTTGERILKLLKTKVAKMPNFLITDKMEEAIKFAYKFTPKNSICLLSTASPSYSLWKNFEEKGDQFQFYANKYKKEPNH